MKIAICGLINSENLGEQFISRSLAWIIASEWDKHGGSGSPEFAEVDILAMRRTGEAYSGFVDKRRKTFWDYRLLGLPADVLYVGLREVAKKISFRALGNLIQRLRHLVWLAGPNLKSRLRRYLMQLLDGADAIVIDGAGLLEYSRNEYQEALLLLGELGEKLGVPVIYNAIGKAGVVEAGDYRCRILQRAFAFDCVRYVSARDSVDTVRMCVGSRLPVELLADAAFCMDLAFGCSRCSDGRTGIGLIRGNALTSYGVDFGEEDWIQLYCNIARELMARGHRYRFFTNGAVEDYELGRKVIARLGTDESCLEPRPTEPEQLIDTISRFEGLITCRMHGSIAAFTMGIPSVILSWNRKVNQYMERVGYPERAIDLQDMNAGFIVDRYEQALREGVSDESRADMREKAIQSVDGYIDMIIAAGGSSV